jgi:DMSO/TMAO reductase YedYZ molybdopterin-dependent catalytic subunit
MTTQSTRDLARRTQAELPTVLVALFAGIGGIAGSYAVTGYTPSFIASPIASFLTRVMPDAVLRFAIVTLTAIGQRFGIEHLGQQLNLLLAVSLGGLLFAALVLIAIRIGRELDSSLVSVGLAGVLTWLAAVILTGAPLAAVGAGGASAVVVASAALVSVLKGESESANTSPPGRRQVLGSIASAIGIGVLGYTLGTRKSKPSPPTDLKDLEALNEETPSIDTEDEGTNSGDAATNGGNENTNSENEKTSDGNEKTDREDVSVQELLAIAEERSLDIEGITGLVSGEDFYEVDINNINPTVDVNEWSLTVTGNVEREVTYSYDDIISMDRELQFNTLRCVSDPLNGQSMDNDLWAGIPIMDVIDEANPQGEFVMLRAVDDYYEEFSIEALRDGFLAYGKNDNVLPRKHGYPVRALIPGHWGEINVKWLDEIEILNGPEKGFWEKRGWHGTGPVNTVAKLHAVNHLDSGEIQVGGHAYAGTRGIKRVEVSFDDGSTWDTATLSEQLPGGTSESEPTRNAKDAWRQWEYTYDPPSDEHTVIVRAVDGTGTLQPRSKSDSPYPNGATGWVSKTVAP